MNSPLSRQTGAQPTSRKVLFALVASLGGLVVVLLGGEAAIAQRISTDGSTPTNLDGCPTLCEISGGTRRGRNRFHSFERFSIDRNNTATFINDNHRVTNVIARVTGSDPSRILGRITSDGLASDFDLYLLNSNGILFGDGARVDIGGAFFASTADALDFRDVGVLNTSSQSVPNELLTINPSAFIFRNGQPAPITVRNLAAEDSFSAPENFALIGGQFVSRNSSFSTDTSIDIIAVGPSRTSLPIRRRATDINFDISNLNSRSNIVFRDGGRLLLRGDSSSLVLAGNNIVISGFHIGSSLGSDLLLDATGNVRLVTDPTLLERADIEIDPTVGDGGPNETPGRLRIRADGSLILETANTSITRRYITTNRNESIPGIISIDVGNSVRIAPGAFISVSAFGRAQGGGQLRISAENVILEEASSISARVFNDAGRGGAIIIDANQISLAPDARISSLTGDSAGPAGQIVLRASTVRLNGGLIDAGSFGSGDGGLIRVVADSLLMTNGAEISTSTDLIRPLNLGFAPATGDGGEIVLNADRIVLDNSHISAATTSFGDAGRVNVRGDFLLLRNGSVITSASRGTGDGGEIDIDVDRIVLTGGSVITSRTRSEGDGGEIEITGLSLVLEDGSSVNTNTVGPGDAGGIRLELRDLLELRGVDEEGNASSVVALSQEQSQGDGGDVWIDPLVVRLTDGSTIGVNSEGTGDGGNLFLAGGNVLLQDGSTITAATASGTGGNIELEIGEVLLLSGGSSVTTEAGGAGDGGNIDIEALFVVAPLGTDGNIIATADQGDGGAISLDAAGIFGFLFALDPEEANNISAASRLGLDGTVTLNQPLVDPSENFERQTAQPVDPTRLVGLGCDVGDRSGETGVSEFVTAGRGGLPNDPGAPLGGGTVVAAEWVERDETGVDSGSEISTTPTNAPTSSDVDTSVVAAGEQLIEAQGWYTDSSGQVVLSARVQDATAQTVASGAGGCGGIS